MDDRVKTTPDVIMASSIVIRQWNKPVRAVLRFREGRYIVHTETLTPTTPAELSGASCGFEHESFYDGSYYKVDPVHGMSDEIAKFAASNEFYDRTKKLLR